MAGGTCALTGAKILGPRIGKFDYDKAGKVTKVNAIPGHNIAIGCPGCFILWFGWYGFNGVDDYESASEAMKKASADVINTSKVLTGIHKVTIITRLSKYDRLRKAMNDLGVTGMTVTQVMGFGIQKGAGEKYRGVEMDAALLPKVQIDVAVSSILVADVIETAKKALYTVHIGDGKIFKSG